MSDESNNIDALSLFDSPSTGIGRLFAHNDIAFAIGLAVVLTTLLIPLPTAMLDVLLSCSIALSLATLLVVLSARESIELSTFPSLLLLLTLFRLSLNVASTRLILLHGDAGNIIHTFGNVVAGGSLIIGLVVFLILVIIQFVVITKGSERISEVAARFNLDAMPGKQMAIDADLNAGLINEDDARRRREKIARENEFYGAMDGASKFVRGDAIAGLVITAVNLIGGFAVGMSQGMTSGAAIDKYSVLAIGDGLVSQIPAIIISTSAGFLISKASTKRNLSQDLVRQLFAQSRPLWMVSFMLAAMIFVPGFPKLPFIVLALALGFIARALSRHERGAKQPKPSMKDPAKDSQPVEELLDVDKLSVQVGTKLIPIVDPRRQNSLSHRIGPLRRKFAQEYGIILPLVRLHDNVALDPDVYEIRLHNHVISTGRLEPDKFMALDPGTVETQISGDPAQEPVFNLPALWIGADKKMEAELNGYTVVDPESVLMTHLTESLRKHAYELLSRDDVQKLVDRLGEKESTLVNEVIGDLVPLGLLHRVLQKLLQEGIPIRDLTHILESLGDTAAKTKDQAVLTEYARKALVRTITEQHCDSKGSIQALILQPSLEHELCSSLTADQGLEVLTIAPDKALELTKGIIGEWKSSMEQGYDRVVMLCDSRLRLYFAEMFRRQLPQLSVLAYDEIVPGTNVESVGTVSIELSDPQLVGSVSS